MKHKPNEREGDAKQSQQPKQKRKQQKSCKQLKQSEWKRVAIFTLKWGVEHNHKGQTKCLEESPTTTNPKKEKQRNQGIKRLQNHSLRNHDKE